MIKFQSSLQLLFVQILLFLAQNSHAAAAAAASPNIVKTIPGFPGTLPFYLETGYVGVGENEQVQLFYYFIKSESDPARDPLLVWLTGGPGCSSLSGLILQNGPLMFNTSACNWHSKAPTYQLNPFSWTKVASIIFLDSPVGTGFSYATNQEGYYTDDTTTSRHIYQFLRRWLVEHAGFENNPLYIAADSYSGMIVPIVVQEISNGNKNGIQPVMNLEGYVLGNPVTWKEDETKSRYEYAHRVSLLSDELYLSTRLSCNGTYEDVDVENVKCAQYLQAINYMLDPLCDGHILKPKCKSNQTWCEKSMYHLLNYWANDIQVREALHIQKGSKPYWIRCNRTLAYTRNVESSFGYHQNITQEPIRALIYSGDQDLIVSYVGTLEWIKMLNVSISEDWKPWFVNGQVAGYTTKFSNDNYHLTHATVKGAGHIGPVAKPAECFIMVKKWLAFNPF